MACQWQAAMPSHDFKQNVMSKNITLLALKLYESITSLKDQNLDNNGPLFLTFIKMPTAQNDIFPYWVQSERAAGE